MMPEPGDWTEAVRDAAARMEDFGAPWCVGGGWAADLFLGRPTRPHADVDLVILRGDEGRLHAHLGGWTLRQAVGGTLVDWKPGERIVPPVHEIHARSPDGAALEFLLNDHDDTRWIYRRDPAVRCPLGEFIVRSVAGVPILCPAVVLLYKSKAPRNADEHDFRHLLPALPARQRRWLRDALAASHPGHRWQALL
jgi:hypothetical protein